MNFTPRVHCEQLRLNARVFKVFAHLFIAGGDVRLERSSGERVAGVSLYALSDARPRHPNQLSKETNRDFRCGTEISAK